MSSTFHDQIILESDSPLLAKALLERLQPEKWPLHINDLPPGTALVGGALRDAWLDRDVINPDLDFVVPSGAEKITRSLAKQLGGTCVLLDADRDMARLVLNGWSIDFSRQMGVHLVDDLWRRDFRLNAIALTLGSAPQILDPTGGLSDLYEKKLVAVSEKNLIEDPLRLLRGIRLMAELHLSVDPQTKDWLKEHSFLLPKAAPERIQSEIQRLINAQWAREVMPLIKDLGLLDFWQNKLEYPNRVDPSLVNTNAFNLSELTLALPLALLTHLLSDDGLRTLRFSRRQRRRCKLLRIWQQRNDGVSFQTLTEVERLQLHNDLEDVLPALILGIDMRDQENWLQRWRNSNDPLFHPTSPVNGDALKEVLDLPSGPDLGLLIRHLTHERAFGRVHSSEEAFQIARYWWRHNRPCCD